MRLQPHTQGSAVHRPRGGGRFSRNILPCVCCEGAGTGTSPTSQTGAHSSEHGVNSSYCPCSEPRFSGHRPWLLLCLPPHIQCPLCMACASHAVGDGGLAFPIPGVHRYSAQTDQTQVERFQAAHKRECRFTGRQRAEGSRGRQDEARHPLCGSLLC